MIDIANVTFNLDAPPLGEQALADSASALFEVWDRRVVADIPLPDYSLYLELTEGSLNGRAKIAAALGAVYLAIGQFGSFVSGVREMSKYGRAAGTYLVDAANHGLRTQDTAPARSKRNAGQLGQLESLFVKVQRGELEPTDAVNQARGLFSSEEAVPAGFMDAMTGAILFMPRDARQLEIPLDDVILDVAAESAPTRRPVREPRVPPIPVLPPIDRYRVEIRRESRRDTKRVSIERI